MNVMCNGVKNEFVTGQNVLLPKANLTQL